MQDEIAKIAEYAAKACSELLLTRVRTRLVARKHKIIINVLHASPWYF